MACVNLIRSWTTAILLSFSQEIDHLVKVIMKRVNIKLWDILGCFHYILNAPRKYSQYSRKLQGKVDYLIKRGVFFLLLVIIYVPPIILDS